MDTPAGNGQQPRPLGQGPDGQRSGVLGSLTIPGRPEQVAGARKFVARTMSGMPQIDSDAATLLTSELVTNAIEHSRSGDGGTVTVTVIGLPDGVLIEVADQGSAEAPVVKSNIYAADGHGLYLVQQLAGKWGYLRARTGTTVWFHLAAAADADGKARDAPLTRALRAPRQRSHAALS